MNNYIASAAREGRWWVITVGGVGVTQCRSLADAADSARGLILAMGDLPDTSDVSVTVTPVLDADAADELVAAKAAKIALEIQQSEVARKNRAIAAKFSSQGLSGRDIATLLDVAPQRVSQLLKQQKAS